jgi:hypothetical protein
MNQAEKFRSDLRRYEKPGAHGPKELDELRAQFFHALPGLPKDLLSDAFMSFLERYRPEGEASRAAALDWLASVAELLSGQDGAASFSREDWIELREMVSANASDMPVDLLTEIMARVMEHGALY